MGQVRGYDFDAVIGVGGIGNEPRRLGISERVNWIGVGARQRYAKGVTHPLITFDHFALYEEQGVKLSKIASSLAERLYSRDAPRFLLVESSDPEHREIMRVLKLVESARPSAQRSQRCDRLSLCSFCKEAACADCSQT